MAWVVPAAATVPSPPMLTTTISRRSRIDGVPHSFTRSERQRRAVRHRAADDHPVVVGVDQPDLAGHEDAADVEVLAERRGVEAPRGLRVDGMAGLDGQGHRKSSRRGVKVSRSTPGPSMSLQPWVTPDGITKASPGPTSKLSSPDGEAIAPGLHEGRLHVRMAVGQSFATFGEGELHQHQLRAVGQHGPGDAMSGIDGGMRINLHVSVPFQLDSGDSTREIPGDFTAYCGPSLPISAERSCSSASVRSVSGGRTGPAPCPTSFAPALTIDTA